jgi:RNA polymerase sigma-70 factor (ECF subfamily)
MGTNHSRDLSDVRFKSFVRDHLAFVVRSIARFGVPSSDIDDVTQEVLHAAYRALPNYDRQRAALRTWLYKIAFRQSRRFLGRAHRWREVLTSPELLGEPANSCALDAEQLMIGEESRRIVATLTDSFAATQRPVFVAYEIDQLPMRRIAALLGISKDTGWSRLFQARTVFTKALKRWQLRLGNARTVP